MSDEKLREITIGELKHLDGPIVLKNYNPAWPIKYAREADHIRKALGERVIRIEHVGSTAVPGLVAKPIIDILLVVADSANESSYVPALETAGYLMRIREPDWHEHRLFKGPNTNINLHVFTSGSEEIERMLIFRDWLRANKADRELYARTKKSLAKRKWKYTQNYADAKSEVVEAILVRANTSLDDEIKQKVRATSKTIRKLTDKSDSVQKSMFGAHPKMKSPGRRGEFNDHEL